MKSLLTTCLVVISAFLAVTAIAVLLDSMDKPGGFFT